MMNNLDQPIDYLWKENNSETFLDLNWLFKFLNLFLTADVAYIQVFIFY